MQYHSVVLNSLLHPPRIGCPVTWDIRYLPSHAARVAGHVVSSQHLSQLATQPGITTLRVISDLFAEDWVIIADNPTGVTVGDVLAAIFKALHVPLTPYEWECMSVMQRTRIEEMFYARCDASRDFDRTRYGGVLRMDCLLHTTVFAGLSSLMYRNNRWEVVLTLSRDFGAHSRSRTYPGA